jgi:hypothetical protein
MSDVTDWIPCWTPPVREGWYEVQRSSTNPFVQYEPELVEFLAGKWDTKGKIPVWIHVDRWRGMREAEC